jgi:hypothetical protein
MRVKWIRNSIVIMFLCVVALLGLASRDSAVASQEGSEKIEGTLLDQFTTDGSVDFIVRFSEQADLTAAYSMDWDTRGEYVYNTLRVTAESSQANAKAILDMQGLTYQTFIAGNDLYVWGGSQMAENGLLVLNELAALPEVNSIRATRTYYIDPIIENKPLININWAGDLLVNRALTTVASSTNATPDWGIIDTKADKFWTTFGAQGEGIVVANIDTGVQWNHPALDQAFKCGTNPSDPACWRDPANICGGSACDNNGHGTHTMGTMVADDDPSLTYIAGMAPNVKWIACKGCETDSCSDASLNACADWILAPNGNPANRPNVVNNSWGGKGGDNWYQIKVQAWAAAGIFPAFSAGNTGSGCSTIGSPGDYPESFASAAHDSNRNIASFSSRGPSVYGHNPYTKPNISAPGVSICSTVPGNGWSCGYSGTSMASPHTAGAVALLWSCNPSLIGQVDDTFQLLQSNTDTAPAGNCGAPPDGEGNYTFGYGYLDVLAAGEEACGVHRGKWTQISLPPGCPDWTRYDGEYFPDNGLVYFMGGRGGPSGSETFGDVISYNPTTNICTDTGTDLPFPISNYTINLVNNGTANVLCTFGGRGAAGTNIQNVQCYNPSTNIASSVTSLPAAYSEYTPGAQVVIDNMVYIIGGFRNTTAPYELAFTYMYNPVQNSFAPKGNLSLARSYLDVAPVNGLIYAFGGTIYDGSTLNAQTRAEVFNPGTGLWSDTAVTDLPTATAEGRAYGFDSSSDNALAGKIVIAAGGQFPTESTEAFTYDIDTNTYDYAFPDLNVSRRDNAGFFIPGNSGAIWVFGGRSGAESPPYAAPEYYQEWQINFLPLTFK